VRVFLEQSSKLGDGDDELEKAREKVVRTLI
jgi:hypothetical protein